MGSALVLALDGSTRVCGVALLGHDGMAPGEEGISRAEWRVLAQRHESDNRSQAKLLLRHGRRHVERRAASAGRPAGDRCGRGPRHLHGCAHRGGDGQRALSLALGVPVTGVSTLSALAVAGDEIAAHGGAGRPRVERLVPVVDARRGQVFYGVYERCDDGPGWARSAPYAACGPEALVQELAGSAKPGSRTLVVSEAHGLMGEPALGVEVAVQAVDASRLVVGQRCLVEPGGAPEGRRLGAWLADAEASRVTPRPEVVKPIYVRSPDADIHITKMRDPWSDAKPGPAGKDGR